MKKILYSTTALIILLFTIFTGKAQSDIDAFRFSQTNWEGTARFMGAGGAFGAVGAEYSALNINPATIGVYKKNEMTFTPLVVSVMKSKADYNNSVSPFLSSNYNLSNFGLVLKAPGSSRTKWQGVQFGFGYNRINDFNNAFRVEGMSRNSSMAEVFVNAANGTDYRNLSGDLDLAFMTYLMDTVSGSTNQYFSPFEGKNVQQKKYTQTSGAIDEMNITVGGNYNDQLYIGATLGIPFVKYKEVSEYEETDVNDEVGGLESFVMKDILRVRGTGVNLKLGIIYQPLEYLRIGLAFHTPTFYNNLKDNFYRSMYTDYDNGSGSDIYEYENRYNYKLVTPLRAIGSVAFLIQKRAFISADYEFTHYGLMNMFSNDYAFTAENQTIQDKYGAGHAIRIGSEVFLTNRFLIRLGYGFKSNPYARNADNHSNSHQASAGFGFRSRSFFFDLAYAVRFAHESYWLYDASYVNAAENKYTTHKFLATLGFKF